MARPSTQRDNVVEHFHANPEAFEMSDRKLAVLLNVGHVTVSRAKQQFRREVIVSRSGASALTGDVEEIVFTEHNRDADGNVTQTIRTRMVSKPVVPDSDMSLGVVEALPTQG